MVFHCAYHCAESLYRHVLLPNRGLAIGRFFPRNCTCCWLVRSHAWNLRIQPLSHKYDSTQVSIVSLNISHTRISTFLSLSARSNQQKHHHRRFAHIGLSITILLDMVLVSRANVGYRVSDKTMVLFGSALADAINQLKYVLFLLIISKT